MLQHLPLAHRDLMADLVSTVESRLGPQLLPSAVPADVRYYANSTGASCGVLDIRSGAPGSAVHCEVPTGALDITTLLAFLNASTDAPHLLMEFIKGSPSSLVLLIDLFPRKDLVMAPGYLDQFYQKTNLDKHRQKMEAIPQALPFRTPSLFIRSMLSPTAIFVNINCGADGESAMEDMFPGEMAEVSKDVLRIWLDTCAGNSKQLEEAERHELIRRDSLIKTNTVEIELIANLPLLFGHDVSDRIIGEVKKVFRVD